MALLNRIRPLPFPARQSITASGWLDSAFGALARELAWIESADIVPSRVQGEITRRLKPLMAEARATIKARFEQTGDGLGCGEGFAQFVDRLLAGLHRLATVVAYPAANPTLGEALQLLALGGYGRGALAPYSDVDLLILLPYKRTARAEQVAEFVLYVLWDLNLKVGHAVRSVDECARLAKSDMVIRTTLLDMRSLAGDESLSADLAKRLTRDVLAGSNKAYVAAKLGEREQRIEKNGDSRYRLEPNVKDGKGALRDLHLLGWIAAHVWRTADLAELVRRGVFLPQEARRFEKAQSFLWAVRTHLHYLVGRAEERLTFDVQREIARRLGYTDRTGSLEVERFMRHYFLVARDVGELGRVFMSAVEEELGTERKFLAFPASVEGFPLRQGRLSIPDGRYFERNPVDLIRIFRISQKTGHPIHPRAQSAISRGRARVNAGLRAEPEANRLFVEIIDSPGAHETLRAMNEAGILGRFMPDWGRVVGQMQFDMYHVYTVDEHTLYVVSNLARMESGELAEAFPIASAALKTIRSRRELYLAALLHDIAKGRGGDHSVLGAQVAAKFCRRLGLSDAETDSVAWLVRWHLAMSDVALKRDLEDGRTIRDFANMVQSPERLRLLLVLTTCDIEGVGPGRWNSWKAGLFSELFARVSDVLSGLPTSKGSSSRVLVAHEAARSELADWSDQEFARFVALGPAGYWLAYDAKAHGRHARLIGEAEALGQKISVATRLDEARGVTEITIYADDGPLLFSQLAGGIAATGLTIVDAKISPLANGKVLDVFSVHDASGSTGQASGHASGRITDRHDRLVRMIEHGVSGALVLSDELARRGSTFIGRTKVLPAPPRVLIDNDASQSHNVIEVNGRDRPGLLYGLTAKLNEINVRVSSAKISTYGHRVVDVFYVTDPSGAKITEGPWLHHIYVELMGVLGESVEKTA